MPLLSDDLRYSLRGLRRSPGFALLAVLTLALGIGANSAIFSVINGVVLKPLGYPEPEKLMMIVSQFPGLGFDKFWISAPEFIEFRERNTSFEEVGAYQVAAANIGSMDQPQRVTSANVSASMFRVLGTEPARGRWMTAEETLPGAPPVVLLSHELWQRSYAGRTDLLNTTIEVEGIQRTVIGIMPPKFDLHDSGAELWMPLTIDPANPGGRGSHFLYLVGRLKDGVTPDQARAELNTMLTRWPELNPGTHTPSAQNHRFVISSLKDDIIGSAKTALWVLQGAVLFVLLIACANMANLLLARAETRHKEFAIRTALGAGRGRLLRQFMTEGMVLAVLGASLGVLVAFAGIQALLGANPDSIPRSADIHLDVTVLLFTLGVSLLTGAVFGLAPLFHLSQKGMSVTLKDGGSRTTSSVARNRVRRGLVVVEVGLAVMLVVGAGLMLKSFWKLTKVDAGFSSENLYTFGVILPAAKYPDMQQRAAFFADLNGRLLQIPGVTASAAMTGLPPSRQVNANDTEFEGRTATPDGPPLNVDYYQYATPDYIETMGIPVVSGRGFQKGDVGGAPPVVLINEKLASVFYPKDNPVGKRMRPCCGDQVPWHTIVGVVKDVKQGGLDSETGTELYFSHPQSFSAQGFTSRAMNVVMRSQQKASAIAPRIREIVSSMDPSLPVVNLRSMDEVLSGSMVRPRFLAQLLTAFAALALALAAIGTYGILSYIVTERRHEIGIRMALGASSQGVLRMILTHGLKVATAGIVLGVLGSFAVTRLLRSLLFNVDNTDPVTYVSVAVFITLVAALACLVPAVRATRVDPMRVLREE